MAYYDVSSMYEPGQLVTQAQGPGLMLPGMSGSTPSFGGLFDSLGNLAQQSMDFKRQQALQAMALADRRQALAEQEAAQGAGLARDQFNFQKQQGLLDRQRQADLDRAQAQNAWQDRMDAIQARGRMQAAQPTFAKLVQGPNQVSGWVAADEGDPGAVMRSNWRASAPPQGGTNFVGAEHYQGPSRASLAPTPWQPSFADTNYAASFGQGDQLTAGDKTGMARRQLMALGMPQPMSR